MALIDTYEEKWKKKTLAAKDKWVTMVKEATSLDAFIKGVVAVTGLDEKTVKESLPTANWAEFQKNADKYVDAFVGKVKAAAEEKKWSKKYVSAFKTKAT